MRIARPRWMPSRVALLLAGLAAACGGGGGGGGGGGDPPGLSVIVVHSSDAPGAADVVQKLDATGRFGTILAFDASIGTPTVGNLNAFGVALVMPLNSIADASALGDHLADFVDQGGGVVVCEFAFANAATSMLMGRFLADDYYAIEPTGVLSGGGPFGLVEVTPGHPVLGGVVTFSGGLASARPSTTTLHPSATLVARWTDPQASPLVATRTIGAAAVRRVDLGFHPATTDSGHPTYVDPASDAILLVANALHWVAGDL